MSHDDEIRLFQAPPHRLAGIMQREPDAVGGWDAADLAAMLSHQLASPLGADLVGPPTGIGRGFGGDAGHWLEDPSVQTFGDLLHHPRPPRALLEQTKKFAKQARHAAGAGLPAEIAAVLYYGSIVVARLRLGVRITDLDDHAIVQGTRRVLGQPWLDDATRMLLGECVARLEEEAHGRQ